MMKTHDQVKSHIVYSYERKKLLSCGKPNLIKVVDSADCTVQVVNSCRVVDSVLTGHNER